MNMNRRIAAVVRCGKKLFPVPVILLCLMVHRAGAQEIDEDALFADTSFMVDSAVIVDSELSSEQQASSVSFSGEVVSAAQVTARRELFEDPDGSALAPGAFITGNFMLDARLPLGVKSFGFMEARYAPDTGASLDLRELFLDFNFGRRIYFRSGKQVLQWGRGYFWNPTDLINVERKTLVDKIGGREGSFGVKMHVPFGTTWNIYSFLDMNDVRSVDSLAGAGRLEVLIGNTEMGAALWGRRFRDPVGGFDISSSLLDWSITGEMSVSSGSRFPFFRLTDAGAEVFDLGDDLFVRAIVGISRMFDLLEIDDRVMVHAEYYFNQAGHRGNVFNDAPVVMLRDALLSPDAIPETGESAPALQTSYELLSAMYEPNSYSRHYLAFFGSISRFIISDLTLNVRSVINLNHGCAVVNAGIQYKNLHGFYAGLDLIGNVGPENTEYTFMNDAGTARITAGVTF
jgi:hypothetical protein